MASRTGSLGHGSIWPWLLFLNTRVTAAKFVTPLIANVTKSNGTLRFFYTAGPSGLSTFKKAEDFG